MDVSAGARPPRPENAEGVGFNEIIWEVMRACWLTEPHERPLCPDLLETLDSGHISRDDTVDELVDGLYEIVDSGVSPCVLLHHSCFAYHHS